MNHHPKLLIITLHNIQLITIMLNITE